MKHAFAHRIQGRVRVTPPSQGAPASVTACWMPPGKPADSSPSPASSHGTSSSARHGSHRRPQGVDPRPMTAGEISGCGHCLTHQRIYQSTFRSSNQPDCRKPVRSRHLGSPQRRSLPALVWLEFRTGRELGSSAPGCRPAPRPTPPPRHRPPHPRRGTPESITTPTSLAWHESEWCQTNRPEVAWGVTGHRWKPPPTRHPRELSSQSLSARSVPISRARKRLTVVARSIRR